MVQFSDELLDGLLAPGISRFNDATVPDLGEHWSEENHWLQNLFLNSAMGPRYKRTFQRAVVTFIIRTQTALREYRLAREATLRCVSSYSDGRPATRSYFTAVSHWETVVLNVQIALDTWSRAIEPTYAPDETDTRIRRCANRIKHYAEDIMKPGTPGDLIPPLWLAKFGIVTSGGEISYQELAGKLGEMAGVCDLFQHPGGPLLT